MKHFFYIIACFVALVTNAAERGESFNSYLPILEVGKKWVYVHSNLSFPEIDDTYTIEEVIGDTIIGAIECKMVRTNRSDHFSFFTEKNGKIDLIETYKGEIRRFPYIDMTLNAGDSALYILHDRPDLADKGCIYGADSISVKGITRKRIKLNAPYNIDCFWVEGIGSNNNQYLTLYPIPLCGVIETRLIGCYMNNELIFTNDDFYAEGLTKLHNTINRKKPENIIVNLIGNTIFLSDDKETANIFTASGQQIGCLNRGECKTLMSGVYIIRCGNSVQKIAIK